MHITRFRLEVVGAIVLAVAFGGLMAGVRGAVDLASICAAVGVAYVLAVRDIAMPRGLAAFRRVRGR